MGSARYSFRPATLSELINEMHSEGERVASRTKRGIPAKRSKRTVHPSTMDGGQDIQATGLNLIPLVQRVRPIEYRLPNAAHGISTNEISNELAKIRNETTREG